MRGTINPNKNCLPNILIGILIIWESSKRGFWGRVELDRKKEWGNGVNLRISSEKVAIFNVGRG